MALSLALPAAPEFERPEYPNAYARVLYVMVYTDVAHIHICWYADEAARLAGEQPVHQESHMMTPSELSGEVFPLAYGFVKSLPNFVGAQDC